jgi:glycosyltransferase involved in cell wall biosynthesis
MRVLLVPGTGIDPYYGGQGSFCRYLAEGLIELGHNVEIAGGKNWVGCCEQLSIPLRSDRGPAAKDVDVVHVNGPGLRRAARELASRHKVVLTHQDHRYICPATTAWTRDGCIENGSRGPCQYCPNRDVWSRTRLELLRFVTGLCCNVAVSSYLLERLSLPNGHAILSPIRGEANSAPGDPMLLAFAGRLVPEKGVDVLIRAVSKLKDIRLEIAGDGPMLPQLRQLAEDCGAAARVHFAGTQSLEQVRELYLRSSVVCVPSIWHEPFGYSAAEALALGRTLVVSDRGALPELVGRDRGWVCRADDPADWTNTLRSVLENEEERMRRCRAAARFVAEELAPNSVAKRYAALYENSLARTDTRAEKKETADV